MLKRLTTISAAGAALFLLSASAARAVDTVGGLGSAYEITMPGETLIDLTRGAQADGSYSTATVFWTGGNGQPCPSAFMLKFYRPDLSGTNLGFLDKRGPFDAQDGLIDVALSPPVDLLEGDYVAITELKGGACGGVALTTGGGNATDSFPGDSGNDDLTVCDPLSILIPQVIGVIARTTGTSDRGGVVLGAGSVAGAQGSNFKTSMQLVNPGLETIQGRLIFHPQGQPGTQNDPSLAYQIGPTQTLAFADVVAAIGTNGLGSIDVSVDSSYAPLVLTRIFNDGGAAGTTGFSEPMVRPGSDFVVDSGHSAWLVAPADFTKFRMNIGVRSLTEGASLTINVYNADGAFLGSAQKSYAADTFDLEPVASYLGALAPPANGLVEVVVTSGKAILAGITVDNISNDTAVQFGTRNHF